MQARGRCKSHASVLSADVLLQFRRALLASLQDDEEEASHVAHILSRGTMHDHVEMAKK